MKGRSIALDRRHCNWRQNRLVGKRLHASRKLVTQHVHKRVAASSVSLAMQAEQAEALSDEAKALVEEQAGSLYGKTHNRSGMLVSAEREICAAISRTLCGTTPENWMQYSNILGRILHQSSGFHGVLCTVCA
jgi:hypothetical protein